MDPYLKKMVFDENDSLQEAIDRCLAGAKKIGFCIDRNGKLLGILTQGDILRALRYGHSISDPARDFINTNPVTVQDTISLDKAKKMIGKRIQIIPRIDSEGHLVGCVDLGSSEFGFINIKNKSVTVLGLGYVGLTLALTLADTGFSVNGYDTNPSLMTDLRQHKPTFHEINIQDFIDTHVERRLKLVSNIEDCASDIFVIAVGTPIDKTTKQPILTSISNASEAVGRVLSKDNLVIVRSTVMVGTTRGIVIPTLEKHSGLKAGVDFHVACCPERTAEGNALKELRALPQIIGGLDEKSEEMASRLFNEYTPTIVNVKSIEAAELCKLMDNVYRDIKFAYANQIAEIAEGLHLNIHELIDAVNLNYSRNDIPKPSPGVGGPCLSKDSYILKCAFDAGCIDAPLLIAARQINESGPERIVLKAESLLKRSGKRLQGCRAFVVGFAFKGEPETSDVRDSTTLWFVEALRAYTRNIVGYDPVAKPEDIAACGVEPVDLGDGFENADAVFLMNNHRSYRQWDLNAFLERMNRPALFYDAWHVFPKMKFAATPGILYAAIGVGM